MHNPLTDDPIPDGMLQRIHAFARDLAFGAASGAWSGEFFVFHTAPGEEWQPAGGYEALQERLKPLTRKWWGAMPRSSLLTAYGYLERVETREVASGDQRDTVVLTPKAFELLERAAPASVFISYRRRESSAFALLVLARMKAVGLSPFLDMQDLEPGDEWHARLKDEIEAREHCVVLVGPTTLESAHVRTEIVWALAAGKHLIPIWHNHLTQNVIARAEEDHPELAPFLERQAIVVEPEAPSGYDNAVVQLLNRFGYTP